MFIRINLHIFSLEDVPQNYKNPVTFVMNFTYIAKSCGRKTAFYIEIPESFHNVTRYLYDDLRLDYPLCCLVLSLPDELPLSVSLVQQPTTEQTYVKRI